MKNVLVTGVNGFVGNHLAKELVAHNLQVIGIGGQQGSAAPPSLKEYFVVDLNDTDSVNTIDLTEVDAVIHLAGLAAVGPSFDNPKQYITTNMGMQVNLFEAALSQGAKPKFLVISSGTLYDPAAALPLLEESTVLPNSPYAISKLGQEQLAAYYELRGFETIIARPFNHIGPGQNLGFIVPDLTKQVIDIEQGRATELVVGNLDAKRDYTDVRDIVRAYRLLLEKGVPGETYNVSSGTPLSGHDILAGILKLSTIKPTVSQDPSKLRASDNPVVYGSHEKITKDTGWGPEISIDQTLADVITDWRNKSE